MTVDRKFSVPPGCEARFPGSRQQGAQGNIQKNKKPCSRKYQPPTPQTRAYRYLHPLFTPYPLIYKLAVPQKPGRLGQPSSTAAKKISGLAPHLLFPRSAGLPPAPSQICTLSSQGAQSQKAGRRIYEKEL